MGCGNNDSTQRAYGPQTGIVRRRELEDRTQGPFPNHKCHYFFQGPKPRHTGVSSRAVAVGQGQDNAAPSEG
jgi:hypothetical protein